MMIANKERTNNEVIRVEQEILGQEDVYDEYYDIHEVICDNDLYEFVDFIFTLMDDYKYTTEDVQRLVDDIYTLIRINNNKEDDWGNWIYPHALTYKDRRTLEKMYAETASARQQKAKIKAGLI